MSNKACIDCAHLRAADWIKPYWWCMAQEEVSEDITTPRQCAEWEYEPGADPED
ncbi:MAG: hypothetical protein GY759_08730 [Chloroflexi bacterium]|nr:hypothetical protein [Chloroflexota bacterium]